MRKIGGYWAGMVAVGVAALLSACAGRFDAPADAAMRVGDNDLGGVVTGANGPEAGVWVIAETTDLPARMSKIVVTDDRGRYLIPELPKANYEVWVRGFGLVDSPKVRSAPGRILNLRAVQAPSAREAAQYYPAMYWYAMLNVPAKSEFPMAKVKSQGEWLNIIKSGGCVSCHALGTPGMRTIPKELGQFKNSREAWARRIRSGQAPFMVREFGRLDTDRALDMFADWTDRVAAGELPFARPERPQGIERNLVVTAWDWSRPEHYVHDAIATDRRNPRVNAKGPVYGTPENSTDLIPVFDPATNTASWVKHPVRDPKTPSNKNVWLGSSSYWAKPPWDTQSDAHNPMMDEKARVWFTARIRPPANPAFCRQGSNHPSAKVFPLPNGGRGLSIYDPASRRFTLIDTCFTTHHLNFAEDANQTLWVSDGLGGPGVIGWLNRRMFEETGDEVRSQGWSPYVLDTNGNGRRDAYVEPDQAIDPKRDKRMHLSIYAVIPNPADGSVWGTMLGYPGYLVRVNPGSDPTHTAITEVYEPPLPGFGPRGGDIDRNGVFWAALASGHLASFDRRKCKVTNGPKATGKHCPEGWTLYRFPGPQFRNVTDPGSAEASYFVWVDWFNTFGLGANVPIAMGNLNDSIIALVDGKLINLRIPYPMGVYPKNVDGRIDDANAGWKGRALWTTTGTRTAYHDEEGMRARAKVYKLQLRPDPLAR